MNKIKVGTRGKDGKIQSFWVDADTYQEAQHLVTEAIREDEGIQYPIALAVITSPKKEEPSVEPEVA